MNTKRSSLMVTAGTRFTMAATSLSGVFLMVSALTVSLTTADFLRSTSWTASAALFAFAVTSTTSTLAVAAARLTLCFETSFAFTLTPWSRTG